MVLDRALTHQTMAVQVVVVPELRVQLDRLLLVVPEVLEFNSQQASEILHQV